MSIQLEPSWLAKLKGEFEQPYMAGLKSFLIAEKRQFPVYPPGKEIFFAFESTPFDKCKVVILGQDPYHGPGQAHGLSFSVRRGVHPPPSLKNIFKELHADLPIPIPNHGDLTNWAQQGVLMLNTVLTVRHRTANSHKGKGWEQFTDAVIRSLNHGKSNLVFVLWGKKAQAKSNMIDADKHLILRSAHPSPYAAANGFFGSRPFSAINQYLIRHKIQPIDWNLPN